MQVYGAILPGTTAMGLTVASLQNPPGAPVGRQDSCGDFRLCLNSLFAPTCVSLDDVPCNKKNHYLQPWFGYLYHFLPNIWLDSSDPTFAGRPA